MSDDNSNIQSTNWAYVFSQEVKDIRVLKDKEFDDYICDAKNMAGVARRCFLSATVNALSAKTPEEKAEEKAEAERKEKAEAERKMEFFLDNGDDLRDECARGMDCEGFLAAE